jgi:hypothetical protein
MSAPKGVFFDGVSKHLKTFAKKRKVAERDIHVRLTLADGTHVIVQGLETEGPAGTYAWGMIYGIASDTVDALLIREDHVVTVEFQVAPIARGPAGLHSEASAK